MHIADVTAFVRTGSDLDAEARSRGTTVYLVDRRYDMLPAMLSENVCSLRARVDRFAVSVVWELELTGNIDSAAADGIGQPSYRIVPDRTWIGRSIIRSTHALTYGQAARLVAGKHADESPAEGSEVDVHSAAAAAPAASDGSRTTYDVDVTDFASAVHIPGIDAPTAPSLIQLIGNFDPAAASPTARSRRAVELTRYSTDPPEGGACGARVQHADEAGLRERLRLLTGVARWLARRRAASGAVDFGGSELSFVLQLTGPTAGNASKDALTSCAGAPADVGGGGCGAANVAAGASATRDAAAAVVPVAVTSKQAEEINSTIAELMIMANEETASLCLAAFGARALIRRHPPPDAARFTDLIDLTAAVGATPPDVSSNASLARSLRRLTRELKQQPRQRNKSERDTPGGSDVVVSARSALVRMLALRAMSRAEYVVGTDEDGSPAHAQSIRDVVREHTPGGAFIMPRATATHDVASAHFGLGLQSYTHFTSPIRRYADEIVHRLVVAAVARPDIATSIIAEAPRRIVPLPASNVPISTSLVNWAHGDKPRLALVSDALAAVSSGVSQNGTSRGIPRHPQTPAIATQWPAVNGVADVPDGVTTTFNAGSAFVYAADGPFDDNALLDDLLSADVRATDTSSTINIDKNAKAVAQISTSVSFSGANDALFATTALTDVCKHLNERTVAAKAAGWACSELFLTMILRSQVQFASAVVAGISNDGGTLSLFVPSFGISATATILERSRVRYRSIQRDECANKYDGISIPPSLLRLDGHKGLSVREWTGMAASFDDVSNALHSSFSLACNQENAHRAASQRSPAQVVFPHGAAIIASRVSADVAFALVQEGALRVILPPDASVSVPQGHPRLCVDVQGASAEFNLLDSVVVALAVDNASIKQHARRPAVTVELLAPTPTVVRLLRHGSVNNSDVESASVATDSASPRAMVHPAAAPSEAPTPAPCSLYGVATTVPGSVTRVKSESTRKIAGSIMDSGAHWVANVNGGNASTRRDLLSPMSLAAQARRIGRLDAARTAASAKAEVVVRGRARFGGFIPPAPRTLHARNITSRGQSGADTAGSQHRQLTFDPTRGWHELNMVAPPTHRDAGCVQSRRWGATLPSTATPSPTAAVFGNSGVAPTRHAKVASGPVSAYGSKSGAGAAASALSEDYGGLRSAERSAMTRAVRRAAERTHDRLDKAKKASK